MNNNNNTRRVQPAGAFPRHGSSGNIPSSIYSQPPPRNDAVSKGVPRAASSGSIGIGGQGGGTKAAVQPVTAMPPKVSNPNPDPCWDDDDDEFWGGSEMEHMFSQLEDTVTKITPDEEKDANCPTPAESLLLHRAFLQSRTEESGEVCPPLPVEETPEELQKKLKAAEDEKKLLQEKANKFQGETAILRREIKLEKDKNKEAFQKKMEATREANEARKKLEEKHNREIACLKAQLQELKMELTKEKMSRSFSLSQSPKLPGPGPVVPSSAKVTITAPVIPHDPVNAVGTPIRTKEKTTSTASTQVILNFETSPPANTSATTTSIGPDDDQMKITWPKLSSTKVTLDVDEDDEDPPSSRVRDKVFRSIERMVDLRFQLNLPLLESFVKRAPKEIMRRLVRQPEEIKSLFPDMVDYMYLWGIDKERQRVRASLGVPEPPRIPLLPRSDVGGWEDFFRTVLAIEIRMREDGVWGGLMEVKDALEELLRSIAGTEGRVKLYERPTLGRLWRLLAWAEELWRCVVIEEESDAELVKKHKQKWSEELEGWTGLVLKTDWRDYFFLELEVEVRKFSLSILASIAAAGYFEQKRKRYIILGRILTDVLTLEVFSKDMKNIRHVLKILTFSVSDLNILRSLCHRNNEGKCLAKLLGDCVAQILKSSEVDGATKSLIYFDFLLFLETLIREEPLRLIQSKVAVENRDRKKEDIRNANDGMKTASGHSNTGASNSTLPSTFDSSMDVDSFIMSQFACPIKYSAGSDNKDVAGAGKSRTSTTPEQVKTEEETLREEIKFWLDPSFYDENNGAENPCKCRRHLVSCAVIGLKATFDLWLKAEQDHEKYLERLDAAEYAEMRQLREILDSTGSKRERAICVYEGIEEDGDANQKAVLVEKATQRLEQRYADLEAKRAEMKSLEEEVTKIFLLRGRGTPKIEWNWNNVVQRQREICGLLGVNSLPAWTLEMRRSPGIIEECLSKAIFFISFIKNRSDGKAPVLTSEAYKVFMCLLPLLRLHLDQFDISRVEKTLILSLTNECDEDSSSPPLDLHTSQLYSEISDQERDEFQNRTVPEIINFTEALHILKPLSKDTIQKLKQRADEEVARIRKLPLPSSVEDEALMAALDAYELNHF